MARFEGTIRKVYAGYRWVNGYKIEALDITVANQILAQIVSFEAAIHYSQVTIDQMRVAGWKTTDINDFITTPLDTPGTLVSGTQPLATPQTCVHAALTTTTGRPGKRFYRYALTQEEVFGVGDEMRILLNANHLSVFNTAADDLFVNVGQENGTLIVGDWPAVGPGRPASGITFYGAANVGLHHGWYNRNVGG